MADKATPARPSASAYVSALLGISATEKRLLIANYLAADRTITAQELSAQMGWSHYTMANRAYGTLANAINRVTGYQPDGIGLGGLVSFEMREGCWHWTLHREVADAIETVGWAVSEHQRKDDPLPDAREAGAWWFGVNNSRGSRRAGSPGHVHYGDIAPFIGGDEVTYSWPFGGAPASSRMYVSRRRETAADAGVAEPAGGPEEPLRRLRRLVEEAARDTSGRS